MCTVIPIYRRQYISSVDVLRILTLAINPGFLSTRPDSSIVSVRNFLCKEIRLQDRIFGLNFHRFDNTVKAPLIEEATL